MVDSWLDEAEVCQSCTKVSVRETQRCSQREDVDRDWYPLGTQLDPETVWILVKENRCWVKDSWWAPVGQKHGIVDRGQNKEELEVNCCWWDRENMHLFSSDLLFSWLRVIDFLNFLIAFLFFFLDSWCKLCCQVLLFLCRCWNHEQRCKCEEQS